MLSCSGRASRVLRASPQAWEVVTDLIERVARLQDEDTAGDPGAWFRGRYDDDPSYSALLAELAAEPTERNLLLRAYFEPAPGRSRRRPPSRGKLAVERGPSPCDRSVFPKRTREALKPRTVFIASEPAVKRAL
jgi:hypothetical protein